MEKLSDMVEDQTKEKENAALKAYPQKRHVITSAVEHSSVLTYCRTLESEGMRVTYLPVDREGICASSGSACLADSDEPSHVVKAMKPDSIASREMIRLSLGLQNTMQEVKTAIASLQKAMTALRS